MHRSWAILFTVVFAIGFLFSNSESHAQSGRKIAPGVLHSIPADLDPRDSFSLPMPLPGLKATEYEPKFISKKDSLYGQSRRVVMFRDVWQYEMSILGQIRQAKLTVPGAGGMKQTRNVWYIVYRIRDFGNSMTFDQVKQSPEFDHIKYDLKFDKGVKAEKKFFLPRFTLEGWVMNRESAQYEKATYRDQVNPMLLRQIQRLEDPAIKLLDSVTMSKVKIPQAKSDADGGAWGVAIFDGVDPRIDYVSVYVKGLSNAFRLGRTPDSPTVSKTLQLNYWRGGDTVDEDDDDIIFGIPLVDDPREQALICKRYNFPGPIIRGYHVNKVAANRQVLVMETDAKVNLNDFQSAVAPILDQGTLEDSVAKAFADAGISVNKQVAIRTVVPGKRWAFSEGEDEYFLVLEPQIWEPKAGGGIRFINSLDSMWIYR